MGDGFAFMGSFPTEDGQEALVEDWWTRSESGVVLHFLRPDADPNAPLTEEGHLHVVSLTNEQAIRLAENLLASALHTDQTFTFDGEHWPRGVLTGTGEDQP